MAAPLVGHATYIGIGKESTWGTAVSRTNWRSVEAVALKTTQNHARRRNLLTGGRMSRGRYNTTISSGGTFSVEATYENVGMLLEWALGSSGSTGSGPYTHTYSLGTAANGLTVEVIRGNATNSEVFEGATCRSLGINLAADGLMMLAFDALCETSAARASAGTPSLGSGDSPVLGLQTATLSWNSLTFQVISMDVSLDNGLDEVRNFGGAGAIRQPVIGERTVTGSFVLEALDSTDAIYAAQRAGTEADGSVTITGSGNNVMVINLQNMRLSDVTTDISAVGAQQVRISFDTVSDGTNHGLTIVVTNDNATATAN